MFYTSLAYLRYLLKARDSHSLHSPFAFALYTQVISVTKPYYAFGMLDTLRLALMQDNQTLQVQDFGAGSKHMKPTRTVSQIARNSAVTKKEGELLFRLVEELQPKTILELGTSLGLSTLYMALVNSQAQVHTFEGCPATAAIAEQNFSRAHAKNIQVHVGNIDTTLPATLPTIAAKIDFAYLDANHRYEPTVRYFQQLLPCLSADAVLVFDDIHWSADMQRAWQEIIQHPAITMSIDLFSFGLAFVSKKYSKENFVLRF